MAPAPKSVQPPLVIDIPVDGRIHCPLKVELGYPVNRVATYLLGRQAIATVVTRSDLVVGDELDQRLRLV